MYWHELLSGNSISRSRIRLILFILSGVSWLSVSCNFINPDEPVPAYLRIDSVSLQTDYNTQGSSSAHITDAWVFVDNKFLGAFPLTAVFPVLGEGKHTISVRAGIIVNGMSSNRAAYPKYTSFETQWVMKPDSTTTLEPVVTYNPGTVFPLLEDFDDASLALENTSTGTASLNLTVPNDPESFENYSGVAILDDNHPVFEVASSDTFALPVSVPVFAELNYKNECEITVGLFISVAGGGVVKMPLLNLRTSSVWKKIYINLSDLGGVTANAVAYKIYLHAEKPAGIASTTVYLDNFKVVY